MDCQKSVLFKKESRAVKHALIRMQPKSITADKMAGNFAKPIWQP